MMNHFGHSIGYHIAEALETELATAVYEKNQATPNGLLKSPGLATGLAWDNYDENCETLSGSGTLHDTVGICYQNILPPHTDSSITETDQRNTTDTSPDSVGKCRKRSFQAEDRHLEPYRKKPRCSSFAYAIRTCDEPKNLEKVKCLDALWLMSNVFEENTPMWIGWNSRLTKDHLLQQKIGYMDNLSLPPTRLDVVAETMKISRNVAAECGQQFAIVHYDVAVAKPALQIQDEESPMYDNVFICFGAFHTQMAYFTALGHLLADSGGP